MKKSTILAGLSALALVLAPAVASAGGSDAPTPYTVTEAGITLPDGDTFPASGHVNIDIDGERYRIHFDPNNDQPGGKWIGKSSIPWSAFGVDSGCVEWVQIHGYNEHFGEGGQDPVCFGDAEPTPDPSISQTHDVQCDAISITPTLNDGEGEGTYEIKAQYYDSETITKTGEKVFTGAVTWGEEIKIDLDPAADDYLLWSYRFDTSVDGKGITNYGERQLDCRVEDPTEPEEPSEPEPEEPGDPETPPVEDPEPTSPETPEGPQTPDKGDPGVTTPPAPNSPPEDAPAPVQGEPRTAG